MYKIFLMLTIALISTPVVSGDALNCIQLTNGERGQILTNTCDKELEVIWCHDRDERGYRDGLCKSENKYYQKHTVLQTGESTENQFSLPHNSTINYAACFGGYYTTKQIGIEGNFRCK